LKIFLDSALVDVVSQQVNQVNYSIIESGVVISLGIRKSSNSQCLFINKGIYTRIKSAY